MNAVPITTLMIVAARPGPVPYRPAAMMIATAKARNGERPSSQGARPRRTRKAAMTTAIAEKYG